jgi:hypothetical protein
MSEDDAVAAYLARERAALGEYPLLLLTLRTLT